MQKLCFILALSLLSHIAPGQKVDSVTCEKIDRQYNAFNKETRLYTPPVSSCSMSKVISAKRTDYYLSLSAPGLTASVAKKGVKIILSSGRILSFPSEEIDVTVSDDGSRYDYSAFITITPDKLALLKKFGVLKWQLYIYENEQTQAEADEFQTLVNCIAAMK